jgi:hypothetical protein
MSVPEPSDYSTLFAEKLAHLGLDARLIGALAALRYRRTPRVTTDVDFLARSVDGLADAMQAEGYEVKVLSESDEPYAVFIRGSGVRVDVLRAETEFERAALDRSAGSDVITAEDVIVFKLLAWRSRDIDDITDILAAGHSLDTTYIEGWAQTWQVQDRWAEAQRLAS